MIVVDASALAAFLFGGARVPPDTDLHAPAVCDLEVASIARRLLRLRRTTLEGAAIAVAQYLALPLTRHEHTALLGRILDLRHNFTAYDASYVALAEQLDVPFLTADARLGGTIRRHLPHVTLA